MDNFIPRGLIFPEQTLVHQELLQRAGQNLSIDGSSLSSFGNGSLQEEDDREWDFSCIKGINKYLDNSKVSKVTWNNMNNHTHMHRFDGKFHCMVLARPEMQCQFYLEAKV